MIVCPNCNHPNPEGAQACEACYTPLPATTTCPSCGISVQTDARFCGQCGLDLSDPAAQTSSFGAELPSTVPNLVNPPLVESQSGSRLESLNPTPVPLTEVTNSSNTGVVNTYPVESQPQPEPATLPEQPPKPATPAVRQIIPEPVAASSQTQLQQYKAQLFHVQTNTPLEIPQNLPLVHIGKPNDRIPPDIDVAGFPSSEVVSRIHADIRIEGDAYYIEDVGSSNGTYVNNLPLLPGNRHRLRVGDRIALGKGDLVTFLFQLA